MSVWESGERPYEHFHIVELRILRDKWKSEWHPAETVDEKIILKEIEEELKIREEV